MFREIKIWATWIALSLIFLPIILGLGETAKLQQETHPPEQRIERELKEAEAQAINYYNSIIADAFEMAVKNQEVT